MEKQKLRITALKDNNSRFAVVFMGEKVVVAFDHDSCAKVGNEVRMISGKIGASGVRESLYCNVKEGSIFELEVDSEFYQKNKNRIKKWKIEKIDTFAISLERSYYLRKMEDNLE